MLDHEEEQGSLFEAGRVVVQVRAVAALVNAIMACLPPSAQAIAAGAARDSLADDPGALHILNAGLRIEKTRKQRKPA
jgi:hypothetical protein